MKVLITGGAGFIGSHLAEHLLKDGHQVVVIDNLSTGSMKNIDRLKTNPSFDFIREDVRDVHLVESLAASCDHIYHLAAAVGVQLIADQPVHTIETNIEGTQVILEAANKFRRKTLIASTSEIYGKNEKVPFAEDDDVVLGSTAMSRWAYACSKAIDEFLAIAFYRQFGLPVVITRFFNTIGPRQTGQYGMVVPRFVQSALKNDPIRIYGTGRQTRCFCYVADVIEAITGLMASDKAAGKAYNIGSTEEVSIEQLADSIIGLTASKSRKEFVPYELAYSTPIEDMMRRVPNIDRIKKTTGWQPKTSLAETLKIIITQSR